VQARDSDDIVAAADTLVDKLRHIPRAEAAVAIALGIILLATAV
jgi:hypothetical protein